MVNSDVSLSDGDSDSSSDDFYWNDSGKFEPGLLQLEWEAVEEILYQEESTPVQLKPGILHECRLWKDSFPYLRVRGERVENPFNRKRQLLRQQILNKVVEKIVNKLNEGAMRVQDQKTPNILKEESYFERGKTEVVVDNALSIEKKRFSNREKVEECISATHETAKPSPRGILKNSPNRPKVAVKARPRRIPKEPTSDKSFRSSSLPRISSKSNNWLSRSEKQIPDLSHHSSRLTPKPHSRNSKKICTCQMHESQIILPPIKTDFKRI